MSKIRFLLAILIGKIVILMINIVDKRRGSNLSGEIAMKFCPNMLRYFKGLNDKNTVCITGTNGKSSTAKLLYLTLSSSGKKVVANLEGANLYAGVVTTLLKNTSLTGYVKADYFVFETDERFLSTIAADLPRIALIITNLQKDQSQRNGSIELIYEKIKDSIKYAHTLILNNDEPYAKSLGEGFDGKVITYGMEENKYSKESKHQLATEGCPICSRELKFDYFNLPNVGHYSCNHCGFNNKIKADVEVSNLDKDNKSYSISGIDFKGIDAENTMLYNQAAVIAYINKYQRIKDINFKEIYKLNEDPANRRKIIKYRDVEFKFLSFKQENPDTLQSCFESVLDDNNQKNIVFIMSEIPEQFPVYLGSYYLYDSNFQNLDLNTVEYFIIPKTSLSIDLEIFLEIYGVNSNRIIYATGDDKDSIVEALAANNIYETYLIGCGKDCSRLMKSFGAN